MKIIEKIKLKNFKKFRFFETEFNDSINLLIGDNESGKSTILDAVDIVLSGSRNKVENYGLDQLFNYDVIQHFFENGKNFEELPELFVELYLDDQINFNLEGKYNSDDVKAHGLLMICEPRDDLGTDIKEILEEDVNNFPFEYYSINFRTFSGSGYSGHKRYIQHILLDNTQINNEYATRSYIKTLYNNSVKEAEKNKHQNEYRKHKENFRDSTLTELNSRIDNYEFSVRTSSKANLETDLTIKEENIEIENRGKGRQCFIKTDFALHKSENKLDIILMEEPENHLSHIHMKKLISRINASDNKQLFLTTHNNLISTRLDLRRAIMLNSNTETSISLSSLTTDTAKFFMKAPNNNILEYILSEKVVLVEGDAEYILMEAFYNNVTDGNLEDANIHIISVGGTSFKRYLDIAKMLQIKTAVITDNDGDYEANCVNKYEDYIGENIKIFFCKKNEIWTFEKSLYEKNKTICDNLFSNNRRKISVQQFMLSNKTEVAYQLLKEKAKDLLVPDYIQYAIAWIRN